MKVVKKISSVLLMMVLTATAASAVPTQITVRVKSKDAKFVGSSMGGVSVTIRDADSGLMLARGTAVGGTGDSQRIMKTPHTRAMVLSDDSSSKFTATVDIDEPTLVEVSAYGPLAQRQSANRVTATQWVVPGKHITGGDAWMMELPGLIVDILAPPAALKLSAPPRTVAVGANVTMMCGCPIEPGGMWDAEKFEVVALLKRDGKAAGSYPLAFSGEASQFEADLPVTEQGTYELVVYAFDPANGNTGVDKSTFSVK